MTRWNDFTDYELELIRSGLAHYSDDDSDTLGMDADDWSEEYRPAMLMELEITYELERRENDGKGNAREI